MTQKFCSKIQDQAFPGLLNYLSKVGYRPHPAKTHLIRDTQRLFPLQAWMQIDPVQGELLQLLVQSTAARKCLEVGVFTGYSTMCMAFGLPATGKIIAIDINKQFTDVAREHWKMAGVDGKISLQVTNALDGLKRLISHPDGVSTFDFAFIDADKELQEEYYELVVQLLRPGGMLLIDNTLWGGSVLVDKSTRIGRTEIMKHNERVYHDHRVNMCLLPLVDGLTVVVKK